MPRHKEEPLYAQVTAFLTAGNPKMIEKHISGAGSIRYKDQLL
jgi:hypothetical protein